ncbi:MAG: AmmeMemoRadiSam system protein A [Deltaproteobacteria bacterium]
MDLPHFTEEQGRLLVKLARRTLEEEFGLAAKDTVFLKALDAPVFHEKWATFVTLTEKGNLRGCIGNLEACNSAIDSVRCNARYAAFNDYRFSPLGREELPRIRIEVSVLTRNQPLSYQDADDLVSKLRPMVDGVILRKGGCSATFLPQVWEQLPSPADFLTCLCRKACLPPDCWRSGHPDILVYQVQKFKEEVHS